MSLPMGTLWNEKTGRFDRPGARRTHKPFVKEKYVDSLDSLTLAANAIGELGVMPTEMILPPVITAPTLDPVALRAAEEHLTVGITLLERGKLADALDELNHSRSIRVVELGPDDILVSDCLQHIADVMEQMGRSLDALLLYRDTLRIRTKTLGAAHADVAASKAPCQACSSLS